MKLVFEVFFVGKHILSNSIHTSS